MTTLEPPKVPAIDYEQPYMPEYVVLVTHWRPTARELQEWPPDLVPHLLRDQTWSGDLNCCATYNVFGRAAQFIVDTVPQEVLRPLGYVTSDLLVDVLQVQRKLFFEWYNPATEHYNYLWVQIINAAPQLQMAPVSVL